MFIKKFLKPISFLTILLLTFNSCGGKLPGADARKYPIDPSKRVAKNLEEGRGFRLSEIGKNKSSTYEFASSNELWRASLDILDFMPLASVNYSGGLIITDWYSTDQNSNESVKISIRFLTNEIRSDAINVIIHKKICSSQSNCKITKINNNLNSEIKFEILKKAAQIKNEDVATIKKETGDYKIPGKNF